MIEYTVSWSQPNTHLFEIAIQADTGGAATVEFALPNWRPGRYLIQNYARNVQDFAAYDEQLQPLPWQRTEKASWRVETGKTTRVTARYKFYANILDAGSSLLNDQEVYINGTNLFMYLAGRRGDACQLKLALPSDWKIATALTRQEHLFRAQSYDELADSPIIASPTLAIYPFSQDGVTYNLAFQGKLDYDPKVITEQVGKIVATQVGIFKEAPFTHYWFLFHIIPGGRWHGVEHSYSASMTVPANAFTTDQTRQNFYALVSHEFFHAWNVKRIMPAVFHPPDYRQENYTHLLWFFEGVTSYYGDLTLKRAGITDERAFFTQLEKEITELQNTPGRLVMSAAESSFTGWLQPDDPENAQISFYNKGELLGLLLDLEIRRRTNSSKSLDDLMRLLYQRYAKADRGVPEDGIEQAAGEVAGSSLKEFFARYVNSYDELPYNQFLAYVGVQLNEEADRTKPEAYLGIRLSNDERATITSLAAGSPAARGGLDRNDQLIAIDEMQANNANLNEILTSHKPGDRINVTVFRSRRLRNFEVTLGGRGNIVYRLKRIDNMPEATQKALTDWHGGTK